MIFQGVDTLAKIRNVESLYLHVDVENKGALSLYRKAGYSVVDAKEPMYQEFTTSLNLHDGATRGRCHHLLCKHLCPNPTWLEDEKDERHYSGTSGDRLTEGTTGQKPIKVPFGLTAPAE